MSDPGAGTALTTVRTLLLVLGLDAGTSDGQLLERVTMLKAAEGDAQAARARVAELDAHVAKDADALKRYLECLWAWFRVFASQLPCITRRWLLLLRNARWCFSLGSRNTLLLQFCVGSSLISSHSLSYGTLSLG